MRCGFGLESSNRRVGERSGGSRGQREARGTERDGWGGFGPSRWGGTEAVERVRHGDGGRGERRRVALSQSVRLLASMKWSGDSAGPFIFSMWKNHIWCISILGRVFLVYQATRRLLPLVQAKKSLLFCGWPDSFRLRPPLTAIFFSLLEQGL